MKLRLTLQTAPPIEALTPDADGTPPVPLVQVDASASHPPASDRYTLRCDADEQVIKGMVSYLGEFGRGSVAIELLRGQTLLWLHDARDVELVKNQFADLVTDWNGYTE